MFKHTPEPAGRYVSCEPVDQMVFVRLVDGEIDLSTYFCNELGAPNGLVEAMTAWIDDTAPAIIAPHFKVSSPVDYLIEGHEMQTGEIVADAKPIFEALRKEMQEQIDRIDALKFA